MWIKEQDYKRMCDDAEFWRDLCKKGEDAREKLCKDLRESFGLYDKKRREAEELQARVKELEEIEALLSDDVKFLREQLLGAKKKVIAYQIYEEKIKAAGQKKSNEERIMMLEATEEAREKFDIM